MNKLALHSVQFFAVLSVLTPGLHAQTGSGDTTKPVVYVGMATILGSPNQAGVYKSLDAGLTWTAASQGLAGYGVRALVADPRNSETLYLATGSRLLRTTNGGVSWSSLPTPDLDDVVIDPSNSSILYGARNIFFGNGGVFKTTDSGASWVTASTGLPSSSVSGSVSLAIHPTSPNIVYVALGGSQYKSSNGGGNWVGVPAGGGGAVLAVDPSSPSTVYSFGPFSSWAMFRTRDDGATWTNITPDALNILFAFSVALGPPGTVYAGTRRTCQAPSGICGAVLKSTDGGSTWTVVLEKPSTGVGTVSNADVLALAVDPANPSTVYAGGQPGFGLHKTTDGGSTWVAVNSGLPAVSVLTLSFTQAPRRPLHFIPLTPCRIVDTRNSNGTYGGPILAGGTRRSFLLPGVCGIPSTAKAYSLNVTAVPAGTLGFIITWPTGEAQPLVSTLNAIDGQITANAAIVPAGSNGALDFFASNDTHLVVDINGYFDDPPAGLVFYPLAPCRVLDTRNALAPLGGPAIPGGGRRSFPVRSSPCGVPSNAQAYVLNVTAVPDGPLGFLSAWPTGQAQPLVSTLNALDGQVTANMAIVPAGAGGEIEFFATNTTNLVVDVSGYFAPAGNAGALRFYAATPCRLVDTRNAAGVLGGPRMGSVASRDFPLQQAACGLPATARAYSLNFTVVPTGPLAFLTAWPTGQIRPLASTLNSFNGQITANAALVPAGSLGAVSVFVTDPADIIVDTNGYFAP